MGFRKQDRRSEGGGFQDDRRSGAERRRYQRILVDLEVDYKCEDTFLFAYITDLSALGIFVRTNNPEPPDTHLNLRFTLPGDEKPLELEGEVIWINPFRPGHFDNINPGMGVRFCDLTPELKTRLVSLVRKIAYLEDDRDEAQRGQPDGAEDGADPAGDAALLAGDGEDDAADDPPSDEIPLTVDTSKMKH